MAFNISNILGTTSRKSDGKSISAATSLDCPSKHGGFAQVLKGEPADRVVEAFRDKSAYAPRLGGMKHW